MTKHQGVALVVGGASGMGRLAAQRWSDSGRPCVAVDINEQGLQETAARHSRIVTRCLDVTHASDVDQLVKEVVAEFGALERVYNGAAIQPSQLLLNQDRAEIHRIMEINYGGLVNVSLSTLSSMVEQGHGSLINFGSIAGWVPNMHFGAYAASKFAVVAFSEVLYHENRGRGVHVCCVCPSVVDTPLMLQATSNPKIVEVGPAPMAPVKVLTAIDKAIAKQRFWVFPGLHTQIGWRLRRFFPRLMWAVDHRAEGF
ncbi:SDR family oxidoreductase [Myxococcota bacterium]|nr:SDR family oxidoreductase [Myxococcota bacterium]